MPRAVGAAFHIAEGPVCGRGAKHILAHVQSRVDHIGIVVGDLQAAIDHLERCFGLSVASSLEVPERGVHAAFVPWGDISLELIEIDGRPFEPGFHHLAVGVDSLDEAITAVRERGHVTTTDEPVTLAGRRTIFVEPGPSSAFRMQLVDQSDVLFDSVQP